jgi:hypothetical protein
MCVAVLAGCKQEAAEPVTAPTRPAPPIVAAPVQPIQARKIAPAPAAPALPAGFTDKAPDALALRGEAPTWSIDGKAWKVVLAFGAAQGDKQPSKLVAVGPGEVVELDSFELAGNGPTHTVVGGPEGSAYIFAVSASTTGSDTTRVFKLTSEGGKPKLADKAELTGTKGKTEGPDWAARAVSGLTR